MRRISLIMIIVTALTVTVVSAAQPPQGTSRTTPKKPLKRVQVTAQTIAKLPAGKPLLIDLTLTGTIYEVAGGIDLSHVRIRTSTDEVALTDLVRQLGITRGRSRRKLLLGSGRLEDFYPHMDRSSQARAAGAQQFTCTDTRACKCKGYYDCLAMQANHPHCRIVIIDNDTGYTYCIGPLGP